MTTRREDILTVLRQKLGGRIVETVQKSPRRVYVEVRPADVPEVSRMIFREMGARFQIATGIDTPTAIEILYHWAFDGADCVVTVKTKLDREAPEIDSIAAICKGAEWIEREMWELLGIQFRNHPDLRRLLLADDWPAGVYPLRRDFRGLEKA
ncbi:MAG: NADH-quinone oxidoreductase subunit C [Planctomycetota bacterium]